MHKYKRTINFERGIYPLTWKVYVGGHRRYHRVAGRQCDETPVDGIIIVRNKHYMTETIVFVLLIC